MRLFIKIAIILILLGGTIFSAYNFLYPSPEELAEHYLELLVEQRYDQLVDFYHNDHYVPAAEELEKSFANFSRAFDLLDVELVNFNIIEETLSEATYQYELEYTSGYFEPLFTQINLNLARQGIFDWGVKWNDSIPLPKYGLEASYIRSRVEPQRGNIYDRYGSLLAGDGSVIRIGVQPARITDSEQLFQVLEENLGLSSSYVKSQYQAPGVHDHWFIPLITVSEDEYAELDPILRPVPGIFFRRVGRRVYPGEENTAHITGYLGEVSAEMITRYPKRDYEVGEQVGRSGIELGKEEILRGQPGYRFYVEKQTGERTLLTEQSVVDGEDVYLTIDLSMQNRAMSILDGKEASVVVLDAQTGEILVLASAPSYNSNELAFGVSSARWQELSTDQAQPMFNRALQGRYPPGSVFKVLTASAALDQGIVTMESKFNDEGELTVEGNVIRNFELEVFADHRLEEAIVKSINTTMAQVGLELESNNIIEYFSRWQLDKEPELSVPAMAGQVGNPGRSQVSLAWTALGQDQVLMTPFQIASFFSVFVNDGVLPDFYLVDGYASNESYEVIHSQTAAEVAAMLEKVVKEGTGTAASVDGLKIIGKTGTAEVGAERSHAWFAGCVEDFDGRDLSFAVLVEDGGVGGRTAAPLINEYFSQLLKKN